MANSDQFGPDPGTPNKRTWFGARRVGYGYSPQTWQGWVVTAVLLIFLVITAELTKGHSPWFFAAIVVVILVPLVIVAIQRQR